MTDSSIPLSLFFKFHSLSFTTPCKHNWEMAVIFRCHDSAKCFHTLFVTIYCFDLSPLFQNNRYSLIEQQLLLCFHLIRLFQTLLAMTNPVQIHHTSLLSRYACLVHNHLSAVPSLSPYLLLE